MSRSFKFIKNYLFLVVLVMASCGGGGDDSPDPITLISATMNGSTLTNGASNVALQVQIELTFSSALDATAFESAFTLSGGATTPGYSISYTNASSKAVIAVTGLAFSTNYTLQVAAGVIGSEGQSLESAVSFGFTTMDDGVVRSMPPCTSASQDCYRTVSLEDNAQVSGNFSFYSNYPIYLEEAEWEDLKYAIIVVHGANRDADNYFSYMTSTLNSESLQESTILISPEFKASGDAGNDDLYWNNDWREGQSSTSSARLSSFEAIDALLERLSDRVAFPVLEKVIITGHSSGALFSQVYGAANTAEPMYEHLSLQYIVANSQYFYYPDNQRYDEQNNSFYQPTGCNTFNHWPLGYTTAPAYVSTRTDAQVDANLLSRDFVYLLGNGSGADPALNTSDCGAVLLGSSRFKRGEHIFDWLETQYSEQHNSTKTIVNGIGHDGQAMYQSTEFRAVLGAFFE